jgi:hypothetical protein
VITIGYTIADGAFADAVTPSYRPRYVASWKEALVDVPPGLARRRRANVASEARIGGTALIVIALILLIINNPWAQAVAIVLAIIGVGLRIEAAIVTSRASSDEA